MIFILNVLLSLSAFSLTLEEIKTMAIEHSVTLKAKEMEEHALISDAEIRGKWQNPQLMGQVGSLKSGSQNGPTVEVSLVQAVPLSDKFSLRRQMAMEAAKAQSAKAEAFKNWVVHQALLAGWRVHVYQELFEHSSERTRRIGIIKKYLGNHPRVSIKQKVELNILSTLLLQLEKMLDQKDFDLKIALSELEYWIGKKVNPKEVEINLPNMNVGVKPILNTLRDPELLEAESLARASKLDFEIASKETRPDIFLGGGYRVENVTPENHFSYGIVGLNIPLWDTGKDRKAATRARSIRDSYQVTDAQKKAMMKQQKQIDTVLFWARQVQRYTHANVPEQEEAVKLAEDGFRRGLIDVNTFLQSESQSHEAIDQIYLSWFTYLENLSLLQVMRGESFSWAEI